MLFYGSNMGKVSKLLDCDLRILSAKKDLKQKVFIVNKFIKRCKVLNIDIQSTEIVCYIPGNTCCKKKTDQYIYIENSS